MSSEAARGFRSDIQALRAVAVGLVVLDHMLILQRLPGHPEGGFIGVDVFFVISGFLITGHLLRESATTGRVSFRQFYARRARRILPMSLLVIVVGCIASAVVFWPNRAIATIWDGLWSSLFVSNIAFTLQGVDYFAPATVSIFQHYWSLSVEEQFYLLWPVLIVGVSAYALKRARRALPILLVVMTVVGTASFLWACMESTQSPVSAYFSTFARGFEFILGALVAALAPRLVRLPWAWRRAVGSLGLVGIAASVWIIQPDAGFPGPMALLPAGAAAAFIAAGTGVDRSLGWGPITARPLQYVGNISYSLYLWHWPVIVITGVLMPIGIASSLIVLAVTMLLSAASYRWVESTVLRSSWLVRPRRPAMRRGVVARDVALMTVSILIGAAVVGIGAVATQANSASHAVAAVSAVSVGLDPPLEAIREEMSVARERDSWDSLTPSIESVGIGTSEVLTPDCWNDRDATTNHCTLGSAEAEVSIAILGDSMAMNWVPGLWEAVAERGWKLSVYAKVGCPYADLPVFDTDGSVYTECDEFRRWAYEQIRSEQPDQLVLASALKKELPRIEDDAGIAEAWKAGVARALERTAVRSTTILTAPPEGVSLASCANRFTTPSQCTSAISDLWMSVRDATEDAAAGAVDVVDVSSWFCFDDGVCPAVIGDIPVRRDAVHMTDRYSERLAPVLDSQVLSHAVPDTYRHEG